MFCVKSLKLSLPSFCAGVCVLKENKYCAIDLTIGGISETMHYEIVRSTALCLYSSFSTTYLAAFHFRPATVLERRSDKPKESL